MPRRKREDTEPDDRTEDEATEATEAEPEQSPDDGNRSAMAGRVNPDA